MLKMSGLKFQEHKNTNMEKYKNLNFPVLECNTSLFFTDSIMKSIGNYYGYFPIENENKVYKITWWCESWKDIIKIYTIKKYKIEDIKKILNAMEDKLKVRKTKYFLVGSNYTIADFYTIGIWRENFNDIQFYEIKTLIKSFPILKEYLEIQNELLL